MGQLFHYFLLKNQLESQSVKKKRRNQRQEVEKKIEKMPRHEANLIKEKQRLVGGLTKVAFGKKIFY